MINRILIATDFSPHANNACHFGAALARDYGAEIYILHVLFHPAHIQGNIHGGTVAPLADPRITEREAEAEAQEHMQALVVKLREVYGPELAINPVIQKGLPSREILAYADNMGAELLVLGVKPRSKAYLLFFGSVAADVMESAALPVLTIPQNVGYKKIRRYVYACDFDKADNRALLALDKLIKPLSVEEGICLHIMEESDEDRFEVEAREVKQEMRAHIEKVSSSINLTIDVVGGEKPIQSLGRYLKEKEIDLIALTTHLQGDFFRLLHPSMTQEAIFHLQTPVLVFHA